MRNEGGGIPPNHFTLKEVYRQNEGGGGGGGFKIKGMLLEIVDFNTSRHWPL
jgi:hypothetical protein